MVQPEIEVLAEPGATVPFDELCRREPAVVALDGYTPGQTQISAEGPYVSLNHHEDGVRLATRSTCEQTALYLELGLDRLLEGSGRPTSVCVNDADPDVCTAVWELRHVSRLAERRVRTLVAVEGLLDTTGGSFVPAWVDRMLLGAVAWAFDPWEQARRTGAIGEGSEALLAVIDEVGERIDAYADGRGGFAAVGMDFELVAERGPVAVVASRGRYARMGMRAAGLEAIVEERSGPSGRSITVAVLTPFSKVDLLSAYDLLNAAEGIGPDDPDRWSGSDSIGGSPRRRGTTLTPEAVADLLAATALRRR